MVFFEEGGQFFGGTGVLLDCLVELLEGLVDLDRAAALLLARGADLLHEVGGFLDARHELV